MIDTDALVTGGSGAIGAAIVTALREAGANVTVIDRERPARDDVAFVACDLGDLASIDAAIATLEGRSFASIVHCAGVIQQRPLAEEPRETWRRVIDVNLTGTIALTQGLLPLTPDGASIVYVASAMVFKGVEGYAVYTATKAGLVGFARSLAGELGARDVRVNVVAPGLIETGLTPDYADREAMQIAGRALKRAGHSEDVAGAVRFLLGPESSFISGQTLVVDGGSVRR
ncbi:SDR family oxidoreductase [Microbacterium sp. X-17]|uniref:SDR family NAD(P)-dependent oxidoreductase n=1 Tax=Microbacterium sp. X-17 TaxID=3144404 RepID=UPI0031F58985